MILLDIPAARDRPGSCFINRQGQWGYDPDGFMSTVWNLSQVWVVLTHIQVIDASQMWSILIECYK